MIDNYRNFAVFNAVANAGSFSAAARELHLSTSVVSHHITNLEQRLGVTLFYRSTRSLSLTPEGKKIRAAVERMVSAGAEAVELLADNNEQPVGSLRIAVPAFGGHEDVQSKIWDFAHHYPLLSISISSSDKPIDLIKEGFDLAIRLGKLKDSSLKSRKVGTFKRVLVASADYIKNHSHIVTIHDLHRCDFIAFSMLPNEIVLTDGSENLTFTPKKIRLEVDSVSAAKSAVCRGLGVQRLPQSEVAAELKNGTLVELLPNWKPPELGVFAVWPASGREKKLTRLLIDFLA